MPSFLANEKTRGGPSKCHAADCSNFWVSGTRRIQRFSSLLALPVSISFCTSEYTQMVFCRPASLRSSGNGAREITVPGGRSSASHSYMIFASSLVLQTMMNIGGRGSSDLAISWCSASHMLPNVVMGVCAYLRTASGLASRSFCRRARAP